MMITWRDPSLEHQITITAPGGHQRIEVSCNCRRRTGGPPGPARYEPIAVAKCWTAEEAWRAWETYHRVLGTEVHRPSELAALAAAEVTG